MGRRGNGAAESGRSLAHRFQRRYIGRQAMEFAVNRPNGLMTPGRTSLRRSHACENVCIPTPARNLPGGRFLFRGWRWISAVRNSSGGTRHPHAPARSSFVPAPISGMTTTGSASTAYPARHTASPSNRSAGRSGSTRTNRDFTITWHMRSSVRSGTRRHWAYWTNSGKSGLTSPGRRSCGKPSSRHGTRGKANGRPEKKEE